MSFSDVFGPALTNFISAAEEAGHNISISSGYRSPDEQARIIAENMHKFGFTQSDVARWRADVEQYGSVAAGQRWSDQFTSATRTVGGRGERGTPMRNWIALPGGSNHQMGNAADLAYGSSAARRWAHDNAERFGLNFRLANEPWHVEPINLNGTRREDRVDAHTHEHRVAGIEPTRTSAPASPQPSAEQPAPYLAPSAIASAPAMVDQPDTTNAQASVRMTAQAGDERRAGSDERYQWEKATAIEDKVIDPTVQTAMDGREELRVRNYARDFMQTLTPQQKMIEMAQFQKARRFQGESAGFEDWFSANRFGGYMKAYMENDQQTLGALTQQQQGILANVRNIVTELPSYSASVMGLA